MDSKQMVQLNQLVKAADFLQKVLAAPPNDIQQTAAIKAFELSFELAWKYLKSRLEADGESYLKSPRTVFREAAEHGIIDNPQQWFGFLETRNLTTHTYVEAVANKVYETIKDDFTPALKSFIQAQSK